MKSLGVIISPDGASANFIQVRTHVHGANRFRVPRDELRRKPCIDYGRTNDEYARLLTVVRTCTVVVKDIQDVEHSIEVTAETLHEAIATALAALQQDNWVGEIGQGFTMVTVVVQQPPIKHEVKMKDFVSWLGRQGNSPAEVMLKQGLRKYWARENTGGSDQKGSPNKSGGTDLRALTDSRSEPPCWSA